MSIILLLLLFLIWMAWSPDAAPAPIVAPQLGISIFVIGYLLLILITGWWGRHLARKAMGKNIHRSLDRFGWLMSGTRAMVPVWFGFGVFGLGWGQAVQSGLGPVADWPVQLPALVLGLMPAILAWMGLWWSQYPADRTLREQSFENQLDNDLPVFAPPTFRTYFGNKLRIQLLFVIVPIMLILCLRDIAVLGIFGVAHTALGRQLGVSPSISNLTESIISISSAAMVFLFAPELLRHVLHTQPLPPSPLRDRLLGMCDTAGMRCREILLWQTQNNMGNAAVMGIFPRVRYVMLSDLLLQTMTDAQIEAVFAHELGHVKHRHMIWYIVFFATMSAGFFAAGTLLNESLHFSVTGEQYFQLGMALAYGGMFWLGFGYISRWFERQADVYAARTMERSITPAVAPLPGHVGPYGATLFASALERVAVVNNIRIGSWNWTHGSIARRMGYIHGISGDPALTHRFDRTISRVYVAMIIVLLLVSAWAAAVMARDAENTPVTTIDNSSQSAVAPHGAAAE
jgi:STE24 endopeptidase